MTDELTEKVARAIFAEVWTPDTHYETGIVVPTFDEAKAEELGMYERAMLAARAALKAIDKHEREAARKAFKED